MHALVARSTQILVALFNPNSPAKCTVPSENVRLPRLPAELLFHNAATSNIVTLFDRVIAADFKRVFRSPNQMHQYALAQLSALLSVNVV